MAWSSWLGLCVACSNVADWLVALGIMDENSGRTHAQGALDKILAPGRRVLGARPSMTPTVLLFQGFLARA